VVAAPALAVPGVEGRRHLIVMERDAGAAPAERGLPAAAAR